MDLIKDLDLYKEIGLYKKTVKKIMSIAVEIVKEGLDLSFKDLSVYHWARVT